MLSKIKWITCGLIMLLITYLFAYQFHKPDLPVNEFAINLGEINFQATPLFIFPNKSPNNFILGNELGVGLISSIDNKIEYSNNIRNKNDDYPFIGGGIKYDNNSIYITMYGHGMLLDSDLNIIRKDTLTKTYTNNITIDREQDVAAYYSTDLGSELYCFHTIVFELPSGNIIHKFPNEKHPLFVGNNNQQQLVTITQNADSKDDKLVTRLVSDWKNSKTYSLKGKVRSRIISLKDNAFFTGMEDGRLLQIQLSPYSVIYDNQISSKKITALCIIDDEIIAAGDRNGQIFLVNIKTGSIKKLPQKFQIYYATTIAYQANTQTLVAGFFNYRVEMWKLKEAAFVD